MQEDLSNIAGTEPDAGALEQLNTVLIQKFNREFAKKKWHGLSDESNKKTFEYDKFNTEPHYLIQDFIHTVLSYFDKHTSISFPKKPQLTYNNTDDTYTLTTPFTIW